MKWYTKVLLVIGVIVFLPLIVVGFLFFFFMEIFSLPREIKEYKNSQYYKDLQLPFKKYRLHSPEYRFYNTAKKRNLPIEYIRQESNGLEYFVYNDTLFLFPDFDYIDFFEEESCWKVDYDGVEAFFESSYKNILSKLENKNDLPVKLLVERAAFPSTDLTNFYIPEDIFVTWSYENSFENEDSPLKLLIPVNTKELYDMMRKTPDLCGEFEITDNDSIKWKLYDDIQITIDVDPRDCCISVSKKLFWKVDDSITHWHPTIYNVYEDVVSMGKRGNLLVIKKILETSTILYRGDKELCPYSVEYQKNKPGVYYLEAK